MDFGTIRINYQATVNEVRRRKTIFLELYRSLKNELPISPQELEIVRISARELRPILDDINANPPTNSSSCLEATRLNYILAVSLQERIEMYQEIIGRYTHDV